MSRLKSRAVRIATAAVLASSGLAITAALTAPAGAAARTSGTTRPAQSGGIAAECPVVSTKAIDGEIAQAKPGADVIVCPGTYHGEIVVTKPVVLYGVDARIDAKGFDTGITVVASGATVQGFTVEGATGEGILVVGSKGHPVSHVTIRDNLVEHNDQGNPFGEVITDSPYAECNGSAQSGPGDCGEGIHLMTATYSVVTDNTSVSNSGGILLSDELGPTAHNVIEGNTADSNLYACGIVLASHQPSGFANGAPVPAGGGVYDNRIASNTVTGNGLVAQGGGVMLATPLPGGAVYDNTVIGNTINDNGLGGVTLHSHTPGQDLNGNVIEYNTIGTNNLSGDPDFAPAIDSSTTGIIVASGAGPVSITISGNSILNDTNGIWWVGPVTMTGTNTFANVTNQTVEG